MKNAVTPNQKIVASIFFFIDLINWGQLNEELLTLSALSRNVHIKMMKTGAKYEYICWNIMNTGAIHEYISWSINENIWVKIIKIYFEIDFFKNA